MKQDSEALTPLIKGHKKEKVWVVGAKTCCLMARIKEDSWPRREKKSCPLGRDRMFRELC